MSDYRLRPIRPEDDAAAAAVIRTVMPEFGCVGAGYSINDPEVDRLSAAYAEARARFYVVEAPDGRVVGCGGITQLRGAAPEVCELQKMYFLAEARGRGLGRRLLEHCLEDARRLGYTYCYLESVARMHAAARLYRRLGFVPLDTPMGATGHGKCDVFYGRAVTVSR